jgi:hypothetical protein
MSLTRLNWQGTPRHEVLVKIALEPVMQFCRKQKASYKQLLYIKNLVQHLYPVASRLVRDDDKDINKKVIGSLLYLNFNNGGFVSYCLTNIANTINALPEQKQRIARLLAYKKRFNQLRMKQGIGLKVNHESVRDRISKWINEEIHYTETKQRLLSVAPTIKDDEMLSDEDRLHFSVSVHVLGILARAAHESKLLLNKNGTAVFRSVAKYCRTVQAKNPGAGSMDRKSHEAERGHKEKAINVLQEMIKRIYGY